VSYIAAGYTVALATLALYAGSLVARRRKLERRASGSGTPWPTTDHSKRPQ
jgi:hypothetical protein